MFSSPAKMFSRDGDRPFLSLSTSSTAIWRSVFPCAISPSTSTCRAVKPAALGVRMGRAADAEDVAANAARARFEAPGSIARSLRPPRAAVCRGLLRSSQYVRDAAHIASVGFCS